MCAIDATWGPARLTLTSKNSAIGSLMTSEDLKESDDTTGNLPASTAWADLALPSFQSGGNAATSSSLCEVLLSYARPDISWSCVTGPGSGSSDVSVSVNGVGIERMLSSFLAAGMTRGLQASGEIWLSLAAFEFKSLKSGWGNYLNHGSRKSPPSNPILLRSNFYVKGQAYTLEGFPTKLAISILLIYCILAVAAIVHAFIASTSSTSWDSIAELTALALISERPTAIPNTSAGIERIGTFRRFVSVKVRQGAGVQIVFDEDEKSAELGGGGNGRTGDFEDMRMNQKY